MNSIKDCIVQFGLDLNVNNNMNIQELLEKRNTLTDIAAKLYGDLYISEDAFWGSPTERQIFEVESQLRDLGYEEEVSEEMEALSQILFDDLVNRGLIDDPNEDMWGEEEDEEI